jgi:hypothetical protein
MSQLASAPDAGSMTMSAYEVRTSIAVADIARAAEFYEGKLGLSAGVAWFSDPDGNTFAIEEGTTP